MFSRPAAIVIFLWIFLSSVCSAAEGIWRVPELGMMTTPAEFKAVDLKTWWQEQRPVLKPDEDVDRGLLPPSIFQLQYYDGKVYHLAVAMVVFSKQASPATESFFTSKSTSAQAADLTKLNAALAVGAKQAEAAFHQEGLGSLNIASLKPFTRLEGARETIYHSNARIIMDFRGILAPMFGKCYLLEREGKVGIVLLMSYDVDGELWSKILDQILTTLTPEISEV